MHTVLIVVAVVAGTVVGAAVGTVVFVIGQFEKRLEVL